MARFEPFCAREKSVAAKFSPSIFALVASSDTVTLLPSSLPESLEAEEELWVLAAFGAFGASASPRASSAKARLGIRPSPKTSAKARLAAIRFTNMY